MYTQHYYHKQTAHSTINNEPLILLAATSCAIISFIVICCLAQCVRRYHQDTSDHSTDPEALHPLLVEERSGAYQTFASTSHQASALDPVIRRMAREERVRECIAETYRIWIQGNAGMDCESDSSDSESEYGYGGCSILGSGEEDESSESESDSESESESSDDSDGVEEVRMPLDMRRLALPKRVEALRGLRS